MGISLFPDCRLQERLLSFTVQDLMEYANPRKRKAPKSSGAKLTAKYRGPNGEEWSGRGYTPKWILESGKDNKDFLIA